MSAPDRAPRRPRRLARAFRRVYQAYFLILFLLGLFLMTDEGLRRFPARFLYNLDPLAAFGTLAASWVLPAALLTALLLVLATVLFGRVFCGWICPLGTLNHLASSLSRPLRRGPGHVLNRWRPHFRTKYFLLVGGLGAALAGGLTVALFDPLSLATRSLGAGLFAAARAAVPATSFRRASSSPPGSPPPSSSPCSPRTAGSPAGGAAPSARSAPSSAGPRAPRSSASPSIPTAATTAAPAPATAKAPTNLGRTTASPSATSA